MVNSIKKYLKKIKKENKKINAILEVKEDAKAESTGKGRLKGKAIVVKANINVKGMKTSCASKVLENYTAPYDATVISRIKNEGGIIIGNCNMDEFACGWSGETSAFRPVQNPSAPGYITGGSSSGSAAAVAAGFCDMALGSDTGGSIRNPASHCGVVGVKPTYGSVSRYGLIDLSMSLDQIGPIAKSVEDAALLLSVIQGRDENDPITKKSPEINIRKIKEIPKNITLGVLDFDVSDEKIQSKVEDKIEEAVKKYGWKTKKVKIPNIDLAVATYYPLVYVEFFSGTRKLDGRRYGKKIEDAAGPEVLRRILGGSEITKAEHEGRYYNLALKVKKMISEDFAKAFKNVDCIVSPVTPVLPHKIGEKISVEEMYNYDKLTIPYNLYGNCALSLPAGDVKGVPVGMQIACDRFEDEKMLQIANAIEKL
ncbi:Asp-tRNA(Asn)/Glu-tRNA(Gln) amidotransferase subunit GatA [Candidatus Pacearchaeota archaeon]|nr:Asp-tRNA(Asn)/Glu-tRNA(Gln) amidotransferase subunit GatA [Candidatus Pacearchaeota archaeon]